MSKFNVFQIKASPNIISDIQKNITDEVDYIEICDDDKIRFNVNQLLSNRVIKCVTKISQGYSDEIIRFSLSKEKNAFECTETYKMKNGKYIPQMRFENVCMN